MPTDASVDGISKAMQLHYDPLPADFSTADASYPQIAFEAHRLHVTFRDWRETTVRLLFHEVASFSWEAGDVAIDLQHRDDTSYIVRGSPWLQRHLEVGAVTPTEEHQHYKLCFNAAGVLQVLATRLEVLAPDHSES
jgi:hypothetical protein